MERSTVIFIIMVMFAGFIICAVIRSVFNFYSSVITRVRLRRTLSLVGLSLLGRFGDFQLPPHIEQNSVHTHNRHVSRTDKQHLSRPQTTTSTIYGYTTGESNQQCELFQDTQRLGLFLIRRLQPRHKTKQH